jgi:hypothetical protein
VELKTLSEFKSSKHLSQILHRLLQYIAEQDSISVSEICKKSFSKTLKDRGNVRKYLRTLLDLKLINIDQEKTNITSENVSETKYYKLSAYGTYYMIEKNDKLPYELLKNMLKYQGDHPSISLHHTRLSFKDHLFCDILKNTHISSRVF